MNTIAYSPLLAALLASIAPAQDFTTSIPTSVLQAVGQILPERSNAGAAYVSDSFAQSVEFSAIATARIIFVHEGAGYQNSLGYFTYTDNPDGSVTINSADLLIQNASMNNVVQAGYGYDLKDSNGVQRTFAAGEKLGFFLIADGNRRASSVVGSWTYDFSDGLGTVPSNDPNVNRQRGRGCFTTVSTINPENVFGAADKSRHMALIEMGGVDGFLGGEDFLLCGFEDLWRTSNSDEDFNDLVFIVEATPETAIQGAGVFRYESGDPDSDGVSGVNDSFPNDGDRASIQRLPTVGRNVLAFEDQYPQVGDADYNDAVISYVFEVVKDANGDVKDILATFELLARGASYDHSFGLHLPGLPSNAAGTVDIERWTSGGESSTMLAQRSVATIVASGNRRIEDLFDSTQTQLPPPQGLTFANTQFGVQQVDAAGVRVHFQFTTPISVAQLGEPPYDPFLYVSNPFYPNTSVDIHLAGQSSFADRPNYLPTESGAGSFIDANGFPFALEVPNDWRFPMENINVEDAYSQFAGWRTSGGVNDTTWYDNASSAEGDVGSILTDLIPTRSWTLDIPGR